MSRASQSTVVLLTEYFAAMEAKDLDRVASFYADDVCLTFANSPKTIGKDAVIAQMAKI